jgi:hypothetical protein
MHRQSVFLRNQMNQQSTMQRIHTGVFIANNPSGLRGDIISREKGEPLSNDASENGGAEKEQLMIRWRGSQKEVPLDGQELVEFPASKKAQHPAAMTKQEELIRFHLTQKANENEDQFYLQERLLSLELGDELTFQIVSNCEESGEEPLPEDVEAKILVRLVEAYYVGQGMMVAHGRHLTSYQKILEPFWTKQKDGTFSKVPGDTIKEIMENVRGIFERTFSGLLFCRAFSYALYRLEYHHEDESILDAYCVVMYAIRLLQGKLDEFMNMEFGDVIEDELIHYKSENVDMTADDLLWCFCLLLLRIGTDLRRTIGFQNLSSMLLATYGPITNEELLVAQLAIEIRPESPVSYLASYRTAMDLKPLVPPPFRENWMKAAFDFVRHGLAEADNWGDPYYQYTFHMIMAYWMPTNTYPSQYSHKELQERIHTANTFKEICKSEVPDYLLWVGEQHEESLQYLLALRIFDKEAASMPALVDAYRYPIPPPDGEASVPRLSPPSTNICHHCRKPYQQVIKCSRCGQVEYCSKRCQAAHWKVIHCHQCAPKTDNNCGSCGKTLQKKLSCSKCGMIHYCNRKCQLAHWKGGHKKDCKLMTILS